MKYLVYSSGLFVCFYFIRMTVNYFEITIYLKKILSAEILIHTRTSQRIGDNVYNLLMKEAHCLLGIDKCIITTVSKCKKLNKFPKNNNIPSLSLSLERLFCLFALPYLLHSWLCFGTAHSIAIFSAF